MFFILQIIAIGISVGFNHQLAIYIPLVIPALYIVVMGPGTFSGGSEVSVAKINELLAPRWAHSEELANYIKKYWVALEYSLSASARQNNCSILAFLSIGVALYYYIGLESELLSVLLGCLGVILYVMAMRINRPLSVFNDPKFKSLSDDKLMREYRLAVTAIVAFSEFFPDNPNYKNISNHVEGDAFASGVISAWRK